MIEFEVLGVPAPQGSKSVVKTKGGGHRAIEGDSKEGRARLKSWRTAVAEAARDVANGLPPLDGPLSLEVVFRLPMPASRPKLARINGVAWHPTKPDGSKLLRSTEDALTDGGLIRDDARICRWVIDKIEVIGWTGAIIRIDALPPTPWIGIES